ncbi:MAG: BatA domain-containing protein [Planctomycetota bacterium]
MTFLNLALLGGVLAFNVPLVIHLLSKSRYKQIDWGAMFLIEQVIRQNRRRIKLEQLIMLLVRCAIPALLALAFAQPILNGWRNLVGDQPGAAVVLLDSSYSMQARSGGSDGGGGLSRYEVATDQARQLITTLPGGSEAGAVRVGGGYRPVVGTLTPERDRLAGKLNDLEADLPAADGHDALRRGVEQLSTGDLAKRDVVLISDFQRASWSRDSGAERQRLVELVESLPVQPALTLMPVGGEIGRNAAVMSVGLSADAIGAGQSFRVRAVVANTGARDLTDLPVTLLADGLEVDRQRITLEQQASGDVVFGHKFTSGGGHTLEVRVGPDDLPADDVYRVAVNVLSELKVLLVSDESGRAFPQNETDFLEVALQPFAATPNAPLADLVQTTIIHPDRLDGEALESVRVVVLANVPRLTDQQVEGLRAFVEAGGGLLVFPGDRVETAWYNRVLYDNAAGILPAKLTGLSGVGLGFTTPARIRSQRHEHPALRPWNDPANGAIDTAELTNWYQLDPSRNAATLADLTVGSPALVQKVVGRGVVILSAVPADADWGDLPTRPMFLPLVQRLVTYAATHATPPRNVEVGRPMLAGLESMPDDKQAVWVDPKGQRIIRPVTNQAGRFLTELPEADRPGFYRLERGEGEVELFAANLSREESRLDRLTDDEIKELASSIGAEVVEDAEAYRAQDELRRNGRPVWKFMWMAVLVLVFGELVLQQWFGKGGRA